MKSKAIEVNETTVECNLDQRQRSSQEILDLADYLLMHSADCIPVRRYSCHNSFCSDIPLWIEITDPEVFFKYLNIQYLFEYIENILSATDVSND